VLYSHRMTRSLAPLVIGPHEIWPPLILAPMSGVTDAPVRRLAARLGAGLVVYACSIVLAFFSAVGALILFALLAIFYMFDQQTPAGSTAERELQ